MITGLWIYEIGFEDRSIGSRFPTFAELLATLSPSLAIESEPQVLNIKIVSIKSIQVFLNLTSSAMGLALQLALRTATDPVPRLVPTVFLWQPVGYKYPT
jgi:hypothetical protein